MPEGADDQQVEAETASRRAWPARLSAAAALRLRLLPGPAFAALTAGPALLAVAWLLPGTGLLLAGRLLAAPMVIIFIPLAVVLCYFAVRHLPASWPRFSEAKPDATPVAAPVAASAAARPKPDVPAVALLAILVIAAGFGVWQAILRSEQVFTTSDPGVYLQYGYWIAEHGTARIPEAASAFGGAPGLGYATPGFTVSGGSISPAFLPGLPLVLAGGTWLGGLSGALLMPAVLGGCALLSFAGLVGRLCGAWWAVAGELVLAASLPEVYTARTPFSEPLVQVLLFGGLCLFIDSLVTRRRLLAGLGGLALGLTVLASIASVGVLLPVFPFMALLYVARRPQAGSFGAGLVVGIGTGMVAAFMLARPYLSTLSPELRLIGWCLFGCYAVSGLVLLPAVPAVRAWVRRVLAFQVRVIGFKGEVYLLPPLARWAQWVALVLPALVLAGLAERPLLQTVRGQTDPSMIRAVAALQHLEGLPVDGLRQYYESSGHWVLWYLGAPALLLACAGAAGLGWRLVAVGPGGRSAGDPDPADPDPAAVVPASAVPVSAVALWGLPFAITAWSVVTVLWDPSVVPWQPMASHRLVAVVLPGLVLLGVWLSSWLMGRASAFGAARTALVVVAACCVLALALPPLVTTLNPGRPGATTSPDAPKLTSQVWLRGVGVTSTYGGSVAAALTLCAAIGPSASVLVTGASTAATFAPAIRGLCGQPAALVVAGPSAEANEGLLEQAVRSVESTGRRPVLLGPSRSSVSLPGTAPQEAVLLRTAGDAESLTGAPTGTWPVTYSAWLAVPAGTNG